MCCMCGRLGILTWEVSKGWTAGLEGEEVGNGAEEG